MELRDAQSRADVPGMQVDLDHVSPVSSAGGLVGRPPHLLNGGHLSKQGPGLCVLLEPPRKSRGLPWLRVLTQRQPRRFRLLGVSKSLVLG